MCAFPACQAMLYSAVGAYDKIGRVQMHTVLGQREKCKTLLEPTSQ